MAWKTHNYACLKCVKKEERLVKANEKDSQKCKTCGGDIDRLVSATGLCNTGTPGNEGIR